MAEHGEKIDWWARSLALNRRRSQIRLAWKLALVVAVVAMAYWLSSVGLLVAAAGGIVVSLRVYRTEMRMFQIPGD